jgi:hypothetical protein
MFAARHLIFATAIALAAPAISIAAPAQFPWGSSRSPQQVAYNTGYDRGQRAGIDDSRRGDAFKFTDESDYKKADAGYRNEYGNRDRYRDEFRRGYEAGYRTGYGANGRGVWGPQGRAIGPQGRGVGPQGRGNVPPWADGRGNPAGRAVGRYDLAAQNGYSDGYEAGLRDGQGRRQFDPVSESRYRSADHGYERGYGSKDAYKVNYRDSFRVGYEEGFNDGRRYSAR